MVNVELTKHQGQLIIDCDVHIADEMNSKSPKNHPACEKQNEYAVYHMECQSLCLL